MKLEDQVTSLALSKRLKELGVKQDSLFHWKDDRGYGYPEDWIIIEGRPGLRTSCSAFTVAELGELLPWYVDFGSSNETGPRYARFPKPGVEFYHYEEARTEADARAKLLILLLEQKLVKP